jgi:hypothetical protein
MRRCLLASSITDYEALNVSDAAAASKELTTPADVRAILAYKEAHKNRPSKPTLPTPFPPLLRGY